MNTLAVDRPAARRPADQCRSENGPPVTIAAVGGARPGPARRPRGALRTGGAGLPRASRCDRGPGRPTEPPAMGSGAECKKGPPGGRPLLVKYVRRRPALPRGPPRSTIGSEGLSFRVRNGAGRFPFDMAAETLWRCGSSPTASQEPHSGREARSLLM